MIEMSTSSSRRPDGRPLRRTRSVTGPTPLETQYTFPARSRRSDGRDRRCAEPAGRERATLHRAESAARMASAGRRRPLLQRARQWPRRGDRLRDDRRAVGAERREDDRTARGSSRVQARASHDPSDGPGASPGSLLPIETINHISTDGEIVHSSSMLGSQKLETRLSTREVAMRVCRRRLARCASVDDGCGFLAPSPTPAAGA